MTEEIDEAAEAEPADDLLATAIFGAEVERFITDDRIGQLIVARAKEDMEAAQGELVAIAPEDAVKIRAAQFKYQVAARVVGWLRDVIIDGHNARKVVEETIE
jgi:hypothetical protein